MMKNENFDEELKNRIKQVFEEHNDSTANEGWNLLRKKYPEKKRRVVFFWWIFAAALFLIALIFGLFEADFFQKNTSEIVRQHQTDTISALPNRYSSTQKSTLNKVAADIINTQKTPVKTASGFAAKHLSETNKIAQNQTSAFTTNTKKTLIETASDLISKQTTINNNQLISATSQQKIQPKTEVDNQNNAPFTDIKNISDSTINQTKNPIVTLKDSSKQKTLATAAKKINPVFAKQVLPKEDTKVKKAIEKSSKFSFALYAGPHINYANGSNNQLGLGAGFSTDFHLNKKFKLSTGLGLMQNNLTYKQDIPSASLNAASSNYTTVSTSVTGTSIQNPLLNSLDTRLLALDIPVNLVYNIFAGKNSISISGGVSSTTFVKEAYNYHYSNSTNSTQNITSFNNFSLAKTLNFAAGFAFPLNKNLLQVEPFLKYPLGGLGSQQLQFGSIGINLKMNIQSFKNPHR